MTAMSRKTSALKPLRKHRDSGGKTSGETQKERWRQLEKCRERETERGNRSRVVKKMG